jgi:hypothetical protein
VSGISVRRCPVCNEVALGDVVKLRHQVAPQTLVPSRGRHLEGTQMRPNRITPSTVLGTCEHCGVETLNYPSRLGPNRSRFCSQKCDGASRHEAAWGRLPGRFWPKVNKDGPVPAHRSDLGPCWIWTGYITVQGYGEISVGRRHYKAHNIARGLMGYAVTDGLVRDHLCRVRSCVRPDHLEEVTDRVNVLRGETISAIQARKTQCTYGHDEWRVLPNGHRQCRACHRRIDRSRRERQREARQGT